MVSITDHTTTCEKCGMVTDSPLDLQYVNDTLLCEFCRAGVNPFRGLGPNAGFDLYGAGRVFGFDEYGVDLNNLADSVKRIGCD